MAADVTEETTADAGRSCPYCRFPVEEGLPVFSCPTCGAGHHAECWTENGGCAVVGCSAGPPDAAEAGSPIGAPLSAAPSRLHSKADAPLSLQGEPAGTNKGLTYAVSFLAVAVMGVGIAVLLSGKGSTDSGQSAVVSTVGSAYTDPSTGLNTITATETVTSTEATNGYSSGTSHTNDWVGGSGYTALIDGGNSESKALEMKQRFIGEGISDAGVIYSSDFKSLNPGYWVVFAGNYPTSSEARTRVKELRAAGHDGAYARFVNP